MPRQPLFRTDLVAYAVSARSNNREYFHLPRAECWSLFGGRLSHSALKYGVNVHAFVLMSNHFHLIATTPQKNLDRFMRHFLTETSRSFKRRNGRINHVFGTRYHRSLLEDAVALSYAYKYLYRNPVRASMCEAVEQYPFSSLPCNPLNVIPISEGFDSYWSLIPRRFEARLRWLNQPSVHEELVGRALRRHKFQFTTGSNFQGQLRALHKSYPATPDSF